MSFTVSPRLSRDEYDAVRALVGDNSNFPESYDAWLERVEQEDAKHLAQGRVIKPVVIHSQEFADWCLRSGVNTSFETLGAFAVAKATREG